MDHKPFYIVGVGTSAGGHQALYEYLAHLPPDLPVALVVVLHLRADAISLADQVLARHTSWPVAWASDGQGLQAGHLYLLPPGQYLRIAGGRFQLTRRDPLNRLNEAVDIFLSSLARDWGPYSVGVILSGAGWDGRQGSRQVQAHGGVVMAQDPSSALFSSMPEGVIGQGLSGHVFPPAQLAGALVCLLEQAQQGPLRLG